MRKTKKQVIPAVRAEITVSGIMVKMATSILMNWSKE
jgi:hypothetical protein